MRKKFIELAALGFLMLLGCIFFITRIRQMQFSYAKDGGVSVTIAVGERMQSLKAWLDRDTDTYYFFIPAFVEERTVYFDRMRGMRVIVNDKEISKLGYLNWAKDEIYHIVLKNQKEYDQDKEFSVKFVQAQNLPAVFINTDSGSMDFIHLDKNNAESGIMNIVMCDGRIDYNNRLERMSGRGNSTWGEEKKPYSIRLKESMPLCGMGSGRKWSLLALARESTNLNTMLAYNMADYLGMDYVPDATWIDLYLNGEYNGIYLLSEAVTTGEQRVNVPDGYLLEMDNFYYDRDSDQNYFETGLGNHFVVNKNISEEEFGAIKEDIQNVENALIKGNYQECFDLDTYVKRYIINEIALNIDSDVTSVYYYLNPTDHILYAGPVWDYDICFGDHNYWPDKRNNTDYKSMIRNWGWIGVGYPWTELLYEQEDFASAVRLNYNKILPFMENMLEENIDNYAEYIRASSEMDRIRWKEDITGYYSIYMNNVRYLKFYLANRLNYLNQVWDISYKKFETPSNGEMHQVIFCVEDTVLNNMTVLDGYTIENLSEMEAGEDRGWFRGSKRINEMIPVYEDAVFEARMLKH